MDGTLVQLSQIDPQMSDALRELADGIAGEVRTSTHDRGLYATDASLYQVEPLAVVIPYSLAEVEATVRWAAEHGVSILPRGAGSSLAGQTVNRAVVIDFSPHCRELLEVDVAAGTCWVEPGIVLDHLNGELKARGTGLHFGPDVATSRYANIGGMIGNNSAGARSILYGRTVENLEAIDAALADGARHTFEAGSTDAVVRRLVEQTCAVVQRHATAIRARFPKTKRRVNGYNLDLMLDQFEQGGPEAVNLAHLLCGSEGTLAVTLRAKLRLAPLPKRKGLAVLAFETVDDALAAVNPLLEANPAAVELLDDMVMQTARLNTSYRPTLRILEPLAPSMSGRPIDAVLLVEMYRDTGDEITEAFDRIGRICPAPRLDLTGAAAMQEAWNLRKAAEPLLHAVPGLRKPLTFVEDTAVDPTKLPEFVRRFRAIVEAEGTSAAFYAHASVGCLHIRPLLAISDRDDRARMRRIAARVTDLVCEMDGALSGEHGDGRARSPLLERFYGPEIMAAFRAIKSIFDPENRLNPGNIVAPSDLLDHLRVKPSGEDVVVPDVDTFFDYEAQHGFGGAVEQCNGAGVCRKLDEGVMCPSYQALRDERHSTRGRGNALRLAITGQFGGQVEDGSIWRDAGTHETLDLCLSCKACKSECPSNVDVAKLKTEYLAQHYEATESIPLKARAVGAVRTLNRMGSSIPWIANLVTNLAPVRIVMERLLDIDRRRSLPRYERSLYRWMAARRAHRPDASRPKVVFFADCFTTYNETRIGQAVIETLEAFGYDVIMPRVGCCGRSMLSVGMARQAIVAADRVLRALTPHLHDDDVRAVIVCEPSCLAAFRDDYLELRCSTPVEERQRLAELAKLPEEFLETAWEEHPRRPAWKSADDEVLLHEHCHQRAVIGPGTSAALLRRIVGDRLRTLDTGCCGMAGSFGYRVDHHDLSLAIGELSLLPEVRDAPARAHIVAPGTSCRQQVHDGTGRHAVHPMELVRMLINDDDAESH
jgi:FAD/FMN-containing dehydrogenase/Fe-S oxidoreductase